MEVMLQVSDVVISEAERHWRIAAHRAGVLHYLPAAMSSGVTGAVITPP